MELNLRLAQYRGVQLTLALLAIYTVYCYSHGFLMGDHPDLLRAFAWALQEWAPWLVAAPVVAMVVFRLGAAEADPLRLFLKSVAWGLPLVAGVLVVRGALDGAVRDLSLPALLFYHSPAYAVALVFTTGLSIWVWWSRRETPAPAPTPTFSVWSPRGTRVLAAGEIDFIRAMGNYVEVAAADERFLMRTTMRSLAARLAGTRLARTHRSYFANLDRARYLKTRASGNHLLVLEGDVGVPVSKSFRDAVRAALHAR